MADQTTTNWADLLYELRGPLQELFPTEYVLTAEIDRVTRDGGPNQNRATFSGNQVRVPIVPYEHQGGSFIGETSSWQVPIALATSQAHITMARYLHPISISYDLQQASMDNAAAQALAELVKTARMGTAMDENSALNGDGTGLLGTVSGGSSGSLTIIFGSASVPANPDELRPGRVVDILTKTTGADPGSGLRRRISTSTDNGDGTVTCVFSTTQQASDGGSGNITFSSSEGAYIMGSYGRASQGLQQALAITGTFENIDKATSQWWQGTDGRGGDTTVKPLDTAMLNSGVRRLWRSGVKMPDFFIGDPSVIDKYEQGLYSQSRWQGQSGQLNTGFEGVAYKNTVLIPEHAHKRGSLTGVHKDSIQMYGYQPGPDFLTDDGGRIRRLTRALPVEVDLVDFYQMGFLRCSTNVFFNNLTQAA